MKKFGQSAVRDECVGVKSSESKRKFGHGEVSGKQKEGPSKRQK